MGDKRKQLTLFLPESHSREIEAVRKKYNPIQFGFIKSHITLCREDEIEGVTNLVSLLNDLNHQVITVQLSPCQRFWEGKGAFIPVEDIDGGLHNLRKEILGNSKVNARTFDPHITIMHPRNSTCTNEIFRQIQATEFPDILELSSLCLIEEQKSGAWEVLEEVDLR